MYTKIVNPKTGRKVNINSTTGKQIIKNYIDFLQLGGEIIDDTATSIIDQYKSTRPLSEHQKKQICKAIVNDKHKFCPSGDSYHRNTKISYDKNTCLLNDRVNNAMKNPLVSRKQQVLDELKIFRDNYHTCFTARNRELTIRNGMCIPSDLDRPTFVQNHTHPTKKMRNYYLACGTAITNLEGSIQLIYLSEIYENLNKLVENFDKLTTNSFNQLFFKLFPKKNIGKKIVHEDPYNSETITNNMRKIGVAKKNRKKPIEFLKNILINYTNEEHDEFLNNREKLFGNNLADSDDFMFILTRRLNPNPK